MYFQIADDRLFEIVKEFGTPLYLYHESAIRENYSEFYSAFSSLYPKSKVLYAYKANSSLAICHILRQEGAGADVVSGGELRTALEIGVKPENIIFTNNAKTREDLLQALNSGIVINLDSLQELNLLNKLSIEEKKKARISFRVNPSVSPDTHPKIATGIRNSKFGFHLEEDIAFGAYQLANEMENLEIVGIHTHIGSQILDTGVFNEAAEKIMEFCLRLKDGLSLELKFVDLGGGLGIPYRGGEGTRPEKLAKGVVKVIQKWNKKLGYEPELWLEPGRYLVGTAGILLAKVQSVKKTPYKNFINLDAGFNTLMRPGMYEAYHRVRILGKKKGHLEVYDIAGNICESGDILARDRKLPGVKKGDIIAIMDAGAYGFSMSSQYNLRPRPAEVLVREKGVELIREREEWEDLFGHQKVPGDLLL